MTRLRIRDYEPQDFLDIELMDYEKRYREGMPITPWAKLKKYLGPAYTVVDAQGRIVFCTGIHDLWPGVGEIWAVFSPLAREYPYTWIAAKKLLAGGMQMYHRLQAPLDPVGCPEAIRFDERLGFKPEGMMRKYGPHGEDMIMYALVRE
jgi:hypothetical protein